MEIPGAAKDRCEEFSTYRFFQDRDNPVKSLPLLPASLIVQNNAEVMHGVVCLLDAAHKRIGRPKSHFVLLNRKSADSVAAGFAKRANG
jgi:hypothetical protein